MYICYICIHIYTNVHTRTHAHTCGARRSPEHLAEELNHLAANAKSALRRTASLRNALRVSVFGPVHQDQLGGQFDVQEEV